MSQFSMTSYQERFGECVNGVCTISTTRQSAITGLLSVGAVIGAVTSGSIANRVSTLSLARSNSTDPHQFGLRMTCIAFIVIHLIGAAIEVNHQHHLFCGSR